MCFSEEAHAKGVSISFYLSFPPGLYRPTSTDGDSPYTYISVYTPISPYVYIHIYMYIYICIYIYIYIASISYQCQLLTLVASALSSHDPARVSFSPLRHLVYYLVFKFRFKGLFSYFNKV